MASKCVTFITVYIPHPYRLCVFWLSVLLYVNTYMIIGGGAYWAGRAAARPLFGSCGPPLSLARPLFLGDVNFFFLYIAIMTGENLQ